MRAKKFLLTGAMLLVAIGVGVSWQASRARRRTEDALVTLAGQRQTLEADLKRTGLRLAAAESARSGVVEVKVPAPVAAKSAPAAAAPASMSEMISKDPELELLELKRQHAAVAQEYGEFFDDLKLSPAQIAKFRENWVKWSERDMDLRAAGRSQDEAGKQTVARLQQQAKADYEAAQAEVLGADGYRRMLDYDRTVPLRNVMVRGLAGAAALEGIPLSAQQGDQLLQATIEAAGGLGPERHDDPLKRLDWSALDARARQILTPAQFALFTSAAPPSGFSSRWKFQLDATIARAVQAEAAAKPNATPTSANPAAKPPGG